MLEGKEKIDLESLQAFLDKNEIPKIKGKPKTFLGIAKQPHYENVLSNIYAFYFNVNEVHKFKDLFISSLLECVYKTNLGKQKTGLENFFDFVSETEYPTNKGGRIDLILSNKEQAIIVENKVYHNLNNDLNDYWTSTKKQEEYKIGIVLSIQPISKINHLHFINITHLQLLNQVMQNIGGYLLEANEKYIVFLKDLYQNVINLSTDIMNTKEIEFYLKNRDEIHYTARFLNRFKDHIKQEVEQACHILNGDTPFLKLNNTGNRFRYYKSIKVPNLMFTVVFDQLYIDSKKRIWIVVELNGEALIDVGMYKEIDFTIEEKQCFTQDFYTRKHSGWAHFAGIGFYLVKDELPLNNLAEFIAEKIETEHLLSIFKKIEDFLIANKK
ncbi:PD-(D/E)XK nuclease family protein [Winogradskyella damuponensis]|uniref:PD-(D/E)XK nuclease superfamily protein n=1 Tax=Winogradskyella damuponensis TaxID=943939 RepID=A0ABP8CSV8_9FLAO